MVYLHFRQPVLGRVFVFFNVVKGDVNILKQKSKIVTVCTMDKANKMGAYGCNHWFYQC